MIKKTPKPDVKAIAISLGKSLEETEMILDTISMYYFRKLLYNHKITLPYLGAVYMDLEAPSEIVRKKFKIKPQKGTLPFFVKTQRIPKAELYLGEKDLKAFDELLKKVYDAPAEED